MLRKLINQFHFTRLERAGLVGLLLLSAAAFIIPECLRAVYAPEFPVLADMAEEIIAAQHAGTSGSAVQTDKPALFYFNPNTASREELIRLGLSEKVASSIEKYRSKGGFFRKPEDFKKIYTLAEQDFRRLLPFIRLQEEARQTATDEQAGTIPETNPAPFDPNTVSADELRRWGLSGKLVSNWIKYREKGGFFRKKEDLKKLYALEEADFRRLEPFLMLADNPKPWQSGDKQFVRAAVSALDINEAGLAEWQQLPGIGSMRAEKIVRYRDLLGGFVSVDQVGETRGLPDSIFQQIKTYLVLKAPVYAPIDLNAAADEDLSRHPYVSDKQARLIIDYRRQHGSYSAVDDLKQIHVFQKDGAWLEKIRPYLRVN